MNFTIVQFINQTLELKQGTYCWFIAAYVLLQHLLAEKGNPSQSMDLDIASDPTFYETFLSLAIDPGNSALPVVPILTKLIDEVNALTNDPRLSVRDARGNLEILTRDQEVSTQLELFNDCTIEKGQFQLCYLF